MNTFENLENGNFFTMNGKNYLKTEEIYDHSTINAIDIKDGRGKYINKKTEVKKLCFSLTS